MGRALLAASLLLAGCFGSHGRAERCDMTKECFVTDALGCCGATPTHVSACEECPSGSVVRTECVTSGCIDPCGGNADVPSRACFIDMGGGCCGGEVFGGDACGACPVGSVSGAFCSSYAPECGCAFARPAPPQPDDGDSPDEYPAEPGAGFECFIDLGSGCCGDYAMPWSNECGCPPGTTSSDLCTGFGGSATPVPSPLRCHVQYFEGCCGGSIVEVNGCGTCPPGTVIESSCDEIADDAARILPPEADAGAGEGSAGPGAPPDGGDEPPPPCRVIGADGCCAFESVHPSSCTGTCPAGTVYEWDCATFC